jgi:PAS domain S-box-containing protein
MVEDITEQKRAEDAIRESEEKFRSVFRDAGVGMVIVSLEGRFLSANRTFCDYLGYTEGELREKTIESITFEEDWPAFSKKLGESLTEGKHFQWFEKRCLHKTGRIVYTQSSASLIRGTDGAPQYFVGEVLDITSRKEAEAALSDMARKLIDAQEQERARIGRELHDDITQRIALVAMELEQLKRGIPETDVTFRENMHHLRQQLLEASKDIQSLSHRLHSSKLEYLGLEVAATSFCKEISEQHKVKINFNHDGISRNLPQEVSLCVYRVLQEALQNAVKHSGVRHFEVKLRGTPKEIQLTVSDSGTGFDPHDSSRSHGLGLVSMRERVRLLSGSITIQSKPEGGTTINVGVPIKSQTMGHGTTLSA